MEYFRSEGIELKVLSGDAPHTVAAIARDAGIPLTGPPADGSAAADNPAALEAALGSPVVGRISPEGKRAVVQALRDRGRYVAMLGDGVNDVPALKAARLAIAQGSGTEMAKSVADIVLVRGDFSAVPGMVAEGRQILRNLQRVAKLYVSKSVFASFLILTVGTTATAYPLLPRHFSLAASITIGIPSFLLALAPSSGPWRTQGMLQRLARFAVPAGAAAGIGVVASYQFSLNALDLPLLEARTVATSVLVLVGLYLIIALEGTEGRRGRMVGAHVSGAGGRLRTRPGASVRTRVLRTRHALARNRGDQCRWRKYLRGRSGAHGPSSRGAGATLLTECRSRR